MPFQVSVVIGQIGKRIAFKPFKFKSLNSIVSINLHYDAFGFSHEVMVSLKLPCRKCTMYKFL